MTLNDAWEKALQNIPPENRPKGDPQMIAMIWSIIAIAISEKGLDDISYIDNNKQIISIPLQTSTKEKTAKEKTKPVKEKVDKANGKEKKTTKEPKPTEEPTPID